MQQLLGNVMLICHQPLYTKQRQVLAEEEEEIEKSAKKSNKTDNIEVATT